MARTRKRKDDDGNLFDGSSPAATASGGNGQTPGIVPVRLHEAARVRYLNYALSVITSRALPDVRDGMKPVQRRILFTMWQNGLDATAKHRKSATVVGDVMGRYHPHGDSAIYEALVRMAQPWVMRSTLIDGSGNFGSIDDDPPAAMRYTECRLTPIAAELLGEIDQSTVPFRPNFDGTRNEPVILPARFPALLVNGSSGIAVGMATNIPPHNLGEVCRAALKLMDDPEIKPYQLIAKDAIQGPDFPTGGLILNSQTELREIYKTGAGAVRMRGTVESGPITRGIKKIYITSIPYGVCKATLVAQIAEVVVSRKLPLVLDVRDISTDDVRIELELKKDADEQMVLAYLYKHTALQSSFNVNLTFLVPTENPEVARPNEPGERNIKTMLWHFLHFRLDVVTNRLEHELDSLNRRIHILEGFELVFDALDEIIKIIRASDGKADAAGKIIKRFKLDEEQTDAILELKLYRLAKLEILVIQQELKDKRKRAREIRKLLEEKDAKGRWSIVRDEVQEIIDKYGKLDVNKRRSQFTDVEDEPAFTAEDFIIDEDNHVLVTRDGWIKRQKEIKDPSSTRLREGDSVLTVEAGSTRATIVFFSNFGVAYSCRIIDVPATTGYGEPIQKLFKLKDGEKIVAALSLDPKAIGDIGKVPESEGNGEPTIPPTHAVAATSDGYALRFSLAPFVEPSTRSGRRYARPSTSGSAEARAVGVAAINGKEILIAAARSGRALLCKAKEVNFLAGPGKGVLLMKLAKDDALLGFIAATDDRDTLVVKTTLGGEQRINTAKYELTSRGGKGREIIKRGQFTEVVPEEPSVPALVAEVEE